MNLSIDSPIGPITIWSDGAAITKLTWKAEAPVGECACLSKAADQLTDYFAGLRRDFDLPIAWPETEFSNRFSKSLANIPFGYTLTYGELAKDLGVSAQAIGQACGANRVPILIPCHRVLGANSLGGFSGGVGVETKVWLLKHEGAAGLLI